MMRTRERLRFITLCAVVVAVALPLVGVAETNATIETLKTSAADGKADAQFRLAIAYRKGDAVPLSALKAAYWLQKSAAQCYAPAQDVLGQMYHDGEGVDHNRQTAAQFFRLAAAQRNPAGLYDWGMSLMENQAFLDEGTGDAGAAPGCPVLDVAALKEQMSLKSSTGDALYSADPAQLRTAGLRYITQAASLGDPRAKSKLAELHVAK
jgi:TPR repeat protein